MRTKVIALDVYGTFLKIDDFKNEYPVRAGFPEFIQRCQESGLLLVAFSNFEISNLIFDLEKTFKHTDGLTLRIFNKYYQVNHSIINFLPILKDYSLKPKQLLVISHDFFKSILGAGALGCSSVHVRKYGKITTNYNFSLISIP